jgi:penicillin-binding protein 1A
MTDAEIPGQPRIDPPEPAVAPVTPLRSRDREALVKREHRRAEREARRNRPGRRMQWRRLLVILVPLSILAVISMVFGIVIAVASELPPINSFIITKHPQNTLIYDDDNHRIAVLTNSKHLSYFVQADQIPPIMKWAIVSIEDKRFYSEPGVDVRGIARAFLADVTGAGGRQGASTITEQLVKVMKGAQNHRTILEKLTEAALAFQLNHAWSKDEILAEYLNNVYFGNGATGIEAAAQTYFGNDPTSTLYNCGYNPDDLNNLCVAKLTPAQAALLAGLVENPPNGWTPADIAYEQARRNTVLSKMEGQGYISQAVYDESIATAMPEAEYVVSPLNEDTKPGYGYFASWVEQQVLDDGKLLPNPYTAGYHVHTTFDEPLQNDAQHVVDTVLPSGEGLPSAALVAINNKTGGVEAMVGGHNYDKTQFNLATQAERQPGSAWKVFDLAKALEQGVSPNKVYPSAVWTYRGGPGPPFTIHNDEASYAGTRTLAQALAYSDNTVFAHVGTEDGLSNVANYAHDFGITTDVSQNPAMTIGGLYTGVTPLDMAHAYSTIAEGGNLTSGSLASDTCAGGTPVPPALTVVVSQSNWPKNSCPGPVGITIVNTQGSGGKIKPVATNVTQTHPVPGFTSFMDDEEVTMMHGVVTYGTGVAANVPGLELAGKTGTTSNYVDAWFIGFDSDLTVAVWVGYVKPKSMAHVYGGKAVYGGTYPAIIFHDFMEEAIQTLRAEDYDKTHHLSQAPLDGGTGATGASFSTALPVYTGGASPSTTDTTPTTGTTPTTTTTPAGATGGANTAPTPTTPTTPAVTGPGGGAQAP